MVILPIGDTWDEHIGSNLDDGADRSLGANHRRDIQVRHAVLQTDNKSVPRHNGLNHLGHPLRVVGLDDEKDEVEFFLYLGDLAEMQRRHSGVDRSRRQIDGNALLPDGFDMGRPLLDKGHIESR